MNACFKYRAIDAQGIQQRGLQQADSPRQAIAQLAARGLTVVSLEAANSANADPAASASGKQAIRRIREQDRILLLQELSILLKAGVPLAEAIVSLESAYARTPLGLPLSRMRQAIQKGDAVAAAFRQAEIGLPEYSYVLIESGEAAGRLHGAMQDAANQLEYDRNIAQEFTNALIYPAVLVSTGVLAVLAIFIVVVPRFASLIKSGRAEIPAISRWVIESGLFFKAHLLESGVAAVVIITLAVFALRHPPVRQALLEALAHMPVSGPWLSNSEIGRWATLLATLLENRVPLLDALTLSARGLRRTRDRRELANVGDALRRGRVLSDILAEQGWIPATRINLIRVGERAGELPRVLAELGRLQSDAARQQMKRLLTLIEPIAILLIGGVVGFIMIAIILAITSLNTAQM